MRLRVTSTDFYLPLTIQGQAVPPSSLALPIQLHFFHRQGSQLEPRDQVTDVRQQL